MLLAAGCAPSDRERPVLADSTVVHVLLELHLLEARADEVGDVSPELRDSVFLHFGITEERFQETLAHLASQPDALADLYSRVLERINVERLEASGL